MNFLEKEFKYIYNKEQALFFTNSGAELVDTGIHFKTGRIFFKFKNDKILQSIFTIWNTQMK